MNYEESIKKPFTDIGKLVVGIILSIVPIVNWIARGFMLECSGVGKYKPSKNMPDWKNFGDYFVKGFLSYVIAFAYAIPAIVVFLATAGFALASIVPAFIEANGLAAVTSQEISMYISQNWAELLPPLAAVAPLVLLSLVLLALAMYLYPMAVLNYLKSKKLSKAFDFGVVWRKAFTGSYFVAWIVSGVIFFVISTILAALPLLGDAIAFFVAGVIAWNLFGQAYRESK